PCSSGYRGSRPCPGIRGIGRSSSSPPRSPPAPGWWPIPTAASLGLPAVKRRTRCPPTEGRFRAPAIEGSAPLGRPHTLDLELVRLTASSLPWKICPTRLSGEFRACCLTIVGGAVMRERFDAAGGGPRCAAAGLIPARGP